MSTHTRSVAFATLGCKLNQFETDSLATQFRDAGYRIAAFEEPADVYVINTCTVTNRADRKSRNLLYRAHRNGDLRRAEAEPTGAPLVVVTGCYVNGRRDELEADGSTYFVPNEQKQSIPALVDGHFRGEVVHPTGSVFDFPLPDRIFHTRSIVKVQDGCDNFCTFCIIPHVRGRATSRPWPEVVRSVREAVAGGAREVVLTGVNMSRYANDGVDFAELVARCLNIEAHAPDVHGGPADFRLRISSLEPDRLTDRFIALFDHPRMVPHLHLCLQSASERVLLAMRRRYTFKRYAELALALRERDPLFNLTTDLIVGFPGETDAELEESLRAIESIGFGHVHTFPYSLRKGTRAERMDGHLPARVKTDRSALVRETAERTKRRYRTRLIGTTERMLVERAERIGRTLRLTGLGEHYVPIVVDVPLEDGRSDDAPPLSGASRYENRFVSVRISSIADGTDPPLLADLVEPIA
ncbi:MAG: tRNA (N(6)-L-threonylcarbamoyladenosine(37)-C(2))-methylthiotransferase MtaB [Spirochaetota bacterium]